MNETMIATPEQALTTDQQYAEYINPQWVRLLSTLGLNKIFKRSFGAELFADNGDVYLDFLSGYGVYNVGHHHPFITQELIAEFTPQVLVLDLSAVPVLEYTALKMMTEGEERLREAGTMLWLVAMNPGVVAVMQRSPLWERLGRERMFFTLEQAVARHQQQTGT